VNEIVRNTSRNPEFSKNFQMLINVKIQLLVAITITEIEPTFRLGQKFTVNDIIPKINIPIKLCKKLPKTMNAINQPIPISISHPINIKRM
jgi:hypothetical protein